MRPKVDLSMSIYILLQHRLNLLRNSNLVESRSLGDPLIQATCIYRVALFVICCHSDLETPISKLEALFEGETLTDRENFDEGVDVSTQRPALRRLRGSLFQKRTSGSVRGSLIHPQTYLNLVMVARSIVLVLGYKVCKVPSIPCRSS